MPSRRRLASTVLIRWNREEPTSFGPGPVRKVPLVEMSTWSRRPLIAWPRISSASPLRVDVGRVEHVQAGVEADVDQPRGLGDVACAPGLEELAAAAERAGAEAQDGDLESRAAE